MISGNRGTREFVMASVLDEELKTYAAHREELLATARGMFVLVKGGQVVDVFASREDALKRGYEEYGNEPFLVKEVGEVEVPSYLTSFQIAV